MMPKKQLTDCVWLPGEHLNGSECLRPTWCLDTAVKSTKVKLHDNNVYDNYYTCDKFGRTNKQAKQTNAKMKSNLTTSQAQTKCTPSW